ncbi:MAG: DUF5689 domain-containing protein [Lentimicrobiaceae bacterium]|nr:DUF5689 domain-containing protein [Lentimicrobiaceae bacterium]
MKKTSIFLIITGIIFTACFKPEVAPPLEFNGEANMTIAELQELHTLGGGDPTLIDTNAIITGLVISTDQFGSSYKELYIQDETGGICLRVANTAYFNKYRIGQRIFVKAKDLYLGNYISVSASGLARYGFYQLGLFGNTEGGLEFISTNAEGRHIFRSGIPEAPPMPKIITSTTDIDEKIGGDYHTLVRLENCYFVSANGTRKYFEPSGSLTTISQDVGFNNGTGTVQARISKYCTFANDILPKGTVNITGILSMYVSPPYSPHQLIICSINDVVVLPPEKILQNIDMNTTNPFNTGWTNEPVTGANWTYTQGNVSVRPDGQETECRFVSPKLNFSGEKNVVISFNYRLPNGGTTNNAQVKYTIDGTKWDPLQFSPQTGATTEAVLKLDDNIAANPNLQIAFQYKTTEIFPIWIINRITFKANVL